VLYDNESYFVDKPVREFDPRKGIGDSAEVVYRLRVDWDGHESGEKLIDHLARFLDDRKSNQISSLVIGVWEG